MNQLINVIEMSQLISTYSFFIATFKLLYYLLDKLEKNLSSIEFVISYFLSQEA